MASAMPTSSARISSAAVVSHRAPPRRARGSARSRRASAAASRRIDVARRGRSAAIGGGSRRLAAHVGAARWRREAGGIADHRRLDPELRATRAASVRNSIRREEGEQRPRRARAPPAPRAAPPARTSRRSVTRSREMRICSAWSMQRLAPLRLLDLAGAGQQRVEVAVLADQLRRGLDADAGRAGDVVDRVAGQRLHVDHPVGADAELLDHLVRADRLGSSACRTSRCRARPAASGPCRRRRSSPARRRPPPAWRRWR